MLLNYLVKNLKQKDVDKTLAHKIIVQEKRYRLKLRKNISLLK